MSDVAQLGFTRWKPRASATDDAPALPPGAVRLDAKLLEGAIKAFLLAKFDNARPSAAFHLECWEAITSERPKVAIAAPRGHAKSTAVTFAYILFGCLFRNFSFPVIFSKTYGIAVEFLRSIKDEMENNEELRDVFRFSHFEKESENDVIFVLKNPEGSAHKFYKFRVMATGVEMPVRGLKWGSRRPDVMMLDDCEDDEEVLSPDRREKLMNKFLSAILPAGSPKTKYRMVGTVLHMSSLLENILKDPSWFALRYEACDDEISEESILWPEMYDREMLLEIRQAFVNQERLDKFNMEYRNKPTDKSAALFQEADLLPMNEADWLMLEKNKFPVLVGGDFAISAKTRRDWTAFVVGILAPDFKLYIVDVIRARLDSEGVVTAMFDVEQTWRLRTGGMPLQWFEEDGAIRKALGYALDLVMQKKRIFLNLCPMNPGTTDKRTRSMPIRARCRAKMVKFDQEAEWWPVFKEELLEFDRGAHDDQVDAFSWLGIGIAQSIVPESIEEEEEEEAFSYRNKYAKGVPRGKSTVTGY